MRQFPADDRATAACTLYGTKTAISRNRIREVTVLHSNITVTDRLIIDAPCPLKTSCLLAAKPFGSLRRGKLSLWLLRSDVRMESELDGLLFRLCKALVFLLFIACDVVVVTLSALLKHI